MLQMQYYSCTSVPAQESGFSAVQEQDGGAQLQNVLGRRLAIAEGHQRARGAERERKRWKRPTRGCFTHHDLFLDVCNHFPA